MGGDAMYRIMQRTRATGVTLQVILALGSWADSDGWCRPSLAQIARRAKCGRTSVKRALSWLEAAGEIQRHPRAYQPSQDAIRHQRSRPRGGLQATTYYEIVFLRPSIITKSRDEGRATVGLPSIEKGRPTVGPKVGPSATPDTSLCTSQITSQAADAALLPLMTKFATVVFDATASVEFNRQQIARELRRHRFTVSDDVVGQIYDDLLRKVAV